MAEPTRLEAPPLPTASASEFVATFAAILALIGGLFLLDVFLARIDREESRAHAANLYADGRSLLAELLPMQAETPDSGELRRRLGLLFIRAGAPDRGAEILRAILHDSPNDVEARAGLGEAALAEGDFGTARSNLAAAARRRSGDSTIARRLQLADSAQAMDPMQRGIGRRVRMERSRRLLALTVAVAQQCARDASNPAPTLADSAIRLLADSARTRGQEPETDTLLELAAGLWATTDAACTRDGSVRTEALALVQAKLSR